MTFRESDGRIVPLKSGNPSDEMKPGNAGAGKAARMSRDRDRAPSVLRDGIAVLTGHDRSFNTAWRTTGLRCRWTGTRHTSVTAVPVSADLPSTRLEPGDIWEPDALTAHVRIYEGATSIAHGSNIVTPPRETRWPTGKTNRILNTKD